MFTIQSLCRSVTFWIFCICVLLFAWGEKESFQIKSTQGELALQIGFAPVQRLLLFDYPFAVERLYTLVSSYQIRSEADVRLLPLAEQRQFWKAEEIPFWKGIIYQMDSHEKIPPLLEKIRQGQVWRVFSPCFLHRDLIHLLFNLSWLVVLGLQIEQRLTKMQFVFLIFCLGAFSNFCQYLVGGPFFLGLSGVVIGFVSFIWSRQKVAPREQYRLPRSLALFVGYFVLGMIILEAAAFFFGNVSMHIANTAHVAGAIAGFVLGRGHLFVGRRL